MAEKREYWGEKYPERTPAAFREGTFELIAHVQSPGESRNAFIRDAVDREIARREREKEKAEE